MSERVLMRERESRVKERIEEALTGKRKRSMAQRRWGILARALTGSLERIISESEDEISVRRFSKFGLVKIVPLAIEGESDVGSGWYEYIALLEKELLSVQIRHVTRNFTANELIGFNNTGNVCVWPSEECLAYYLLKNRDICRNRRVLELGGGMSCLAGVLAAKYCQSKAVTLTDGNVTSVDNVRCIVAWNGLGDSVECGVVQWARAARALKHRDASVNRFKNWGMEVEVEVEVEEGNWRLTERLYDVILCADCLFFDETRLDLVETIYGWLSEEGTALVMAPRRGTTFQRFAEAAIERGFNAHQVERYDGEVWSRHLELLEHSQEYSPDLHYPLLLELTKQKKTPSG